MKVRSESDLERVWEHADGTVWHEDLATGGWRQLGGEPRSRVPRRLRKHAHAALVFGAGVAAGLGGLALVTFTR